MNLIMDTMEFIFDIILSVLGIAIVISVTFLVLFLGYVGLRYVTGYGYDHVEVTVVDKHKEVDRSGDVSFSLTGKDLETGQYYTERVSSEVFYKASKDGKVTLEVFKKVD